MSVIKLCTKCLIYKDISEYYVSKSKPNGSSYCKSCKSIYEKEHYNLDIKRKYQKKNKDVIKKQQNDGYKRRRKENLEWLISHLGGEIHCEICRYNKSYSALQLHHTNPKTKKNIRDTLGNWIVQLSLKTFKKKILTTEFSIICANCHFELHSKGVL